ncbi:MAG: hypothetical protein ACRDQA_27605 [Nocardioidaceae bacterium]
MIWTTTAPAWVLACRARRPRSGSCGGLDDEQATAALVALHGHY